MAPEQARTGPVGCASDIFASGGLLLLAPRADPLFGAGSPTEVLFGSSTSLRTCPGWSRPTRCCAHW
ncbi:hypothetical protein [Streptomyces sp. NPDC007856]|uniref:hypothetical protein n=1 Tax=Streptomyces sp. NPDC007856 TaxID=3364781 RepID=UPI00367B1268